MKPLIKYRGGKSKEIPNIEKQIPQFNGRYIEPFLVSKEHSNLLAHTQIYNKDYKEIFDMTKSNDFVFLDSPYIDFVGFLLKKKYTGIRGLVKK